MHDRLTNGTSFCVLNIIDDYNREVLTITADRTISSGRVIRELDKLLEWRGKPEQIVSLLRSAYCEGGHGISNLRKKTYAQFTGEIFSHH